MRATKAGERKATIKEVGGSKLKKRSECWSKQKSTKLKECEDMKNIKRRLDRNTKKDNAKTIATRKE
jgi:hypothetical protein